MENSVDTAHLHILCIKSSSPTSDNLAKFEVEAFDHGLINRRFFKDGKVEEHSLLFPRVLRQANRTQIRVPIDDTHTWIVYVHFVPDSAAPRANKDDVPVSYRKPFKDPPGARTSNSMNLCASEEPARSRIIYLRNSDRRRGKSALKPGVGK